MKKKLITITAISLFSMVALVVGVNATQSKCEKIGQKYGVERGNACLAKSVITGE
jgi:hypothetical protein